MKKLVIKLNDNADPRIEGVMKLLGPEVYKYTWVVSDLELVNGAALYRKWTDNEMRPLLMSGKELMEGVKDILQVIWGVFLALPEGVEAPREVSAEFSDKDSPQSPHAVFEFRGFDGTYIECFFKDEKWVEKFQNVFGAR